MVKSMNIAWWVQRWKELHPEKAAGDQFCHGIDADSTGRDMA